MLSTLAKWKRLSKRDAELEPLIGRGALFLLKNTGADGVWSSSQSTVRALLALIEISSVTKEDRASSMDVLVNGTHAGRIALGNGRTVSGPAIIDVSRLVSVGATNEIRLVAEGTRAIQVQFNGTWYEPWAQPRKAKDFTLETSLSTRAAAINEPVTCKVKVSRPSFQGYGMMIAEIGLPPGVEVDRGTLANVISDPKSGVDSFEVAPDHVTFYIWPRASDSSFEFVFRPRFAMKARMAQSVLYDYYNPDERVLLVPEEFNVN